MKKNNFELKRLRNTINELQLESANILETKAMDE